MYQSHLADQVDAHRLLVQVGQLGHGRNSDLHRSCAP